jgi:hypothetical protein
MVMIYLLIGFVFGVIFSYFVWIRKLVNNETELRQAVHDCIKSGMLVRHEEEE